MNNAAKPRILLVEDDDDVRETAHTMLTNLGYTVLTAANGQDALAVFDDGADIDLLFTDVIMPGDITGRGLAEKLRETRNDLPVLYTSGYVQDTFLHDGQLEAGIELLSKPYAEDELARKIRKILGSKGTPVTSPETPFVPQSAPRDIATLHGLRVLLCEDETLIRLDLAEGLRDAGCEVLEAASAAAALEQLNNGPVGILITDVGLPDRRGDALARDARALHPDMPIIFSTGESNVDAADELGNCDVLTKPFGEAQLLAAIKGFL